MNRSRSFHVLAISMGFVLSAAVVPSHGQRGDQGRPGQAAAVEDADILRITKIEGMGSRYRVKTPDYNARTNIPGGTKPAREWGMILVEYDTAPEWIDELVFQYFVLAEGEEDDRKVYSMYKTTVTYVDIEEGSDHRSAVFLRPSALRRYGEVGAVAVEISYQGNVIARATDTEIRNLPPEEWWRDKRVTESQAVTIRDGYLLDKSQTPFAFVHIDDFEDIQ